jgi:hypothetical protein
MSALAGKAYVDAWVNPYCQSEHLNKLLAEVLANGPYDVVHFNMGLHGWQKGRIKEGTFEPLTKAYVQFVRDTLPQAKIIWASSTPVTVKGQPTQLDPEINPIIVEHNRMAAKVMQEMNVPVNDFYWLLAPKLELARGDQFHWRPEAYTILAETVTTSVLRELDQRATQRTNASAEPETAEKHRPAGDPLQATGERSFLMGLTPMNFDDSPEGTARMKETLAKNAEVVAVYLDWGVPWPEAFEGRPFHENVVREVAAVKQRISPQHQVFLALNAGAFNRREMAGYPHLRGFTPETLPKRWLADVRKLAPDKVFLVAETGYPAASYKGAWRFNQQIQVDSSPPMQAAYMRWLLAESNRLDARLVTWFFPEDINSYLEDELKLAPEAAGIATMAMNLGLYEQESRPRPALDEWKKWRKKQPAQRP